MNGNLPLAGLIRREIEAHGAIPWARFMELCLYAPGLGYYEREDRVVGRRGDFFTSVSVGSLFGKLLAFRFAQQTQERGVRNAECEMQWVEAGAHDGRLAVDILGWLRERRPELFATMKYWIVEPSPRRQAWQEKTLAEFSHHVCWTDDARRIPHSSFRIIFCNELLDAMPVHRLGWDSQSSQWFEWGVAWEAPLFVWQRLPGPAPAALLPAAVRSPHSTSEQPWPDGYIVEVSPAAERWWREAAASLTRGQLIAFDYGLSEEELYAPHRSHGTLRAYHRHHLGTDLLADPGEQDLTAHVNFTALQRVGEAAGLSTDQLVPQSQFLTAIAARVWAEPGRFGAWTARHTRQFQTLTHPEHLGRAFRVLVQTR